MHESVVCRSIAVMFRSAYIVKIGQGNTLIGLLLFHGRYFESNLQRTEKHHVIKKNTTTEICLRPNYVKISNFAAK